MAIWYCRWCLKGRERLFFAGSRMCGLCGTIKGAAIALAILAALVGVYLVIGN